MAQRSCSGQAALEVLMEAAGHLNIPLSTVASRLVDTIASRSP
jgi:hypothetical protein